jgi:hypothetical protein
MSNAKKLYLDPRACAQHHRAEFEALEAAFAPPADLKSLAG